MNRVLSDLMLGEEPVIGTNYMVPCIDVSKLKFPNRPMEFNGNKHVMTTIPVIGKFHTDPELKFCGGEQRHIHVDLRFITEFEYKHIWGQDINKLSDGKYQGFPIVSTTETAEIFLHEKMCNWRMPDTTERLSDGGCYFADLENKMENKKLNLETLVCPHHATPLRSQCVRDGKVVCPLHGLVWDINTGKLVRKTLAPSEEEKAVVEKRACFIN